MRCEVLRCMNNKDGYCPLDSYIQIEEDGTCSKMHIALEDLEEIEEEGYSCQSNFQPTEMEKISPNGRWNPITEVLL